MDETDWPYSNGRFLPLATNDRLGGYDRYPGDYPNERYRTPGDGFEYFSRHASPEGEIHRDQRFSGSGYSDPSQTKLSDPYRDRYGRIQGSILRPGSMPTWEEPTYTDTFSRRFQVHDEYLTGMSNRATYYTRPDHYDRTLDSRQTFFSDARDEYQKPTMVDSSSMPAIQYILPPTTATDNYTLSARHEGTRDNGGLMRGRFVDQCEYPAGKRPVQLAALVSAAGRFRKSTSGQLSIYEQRNLPSTEACATGSNTVKILNPRFLPGSGITQNHTSSILPPTSTDLDASKTVGNRTSRHICDDCSAYIEDQESDLHGATLSGLRWIHSEGELINVTHPTPR
jgi:hypothetical protein